MRAFKQVEYTIELDEYNYVVEVAITGTASHWSWEHPQNEDREWSIDKITRVDENGLETKASLFDELRYCVESLVKEEDLDYE